MAATTINAIMPIATNGPRELLGRSSGIRTDRCLRPGAAPHVRHLFWLSAASGTLQLPAQPKKPKPRLANKRELASSVVFSA